MCKRFFNYPVQETSRERCKGYTENWTFSEKHITWKTKFSVKCTMIHNIMSSKDFQRKLKMQNDFKFQGQFSF